MQEYTGKELIIMACANCNIKCSHCYISYKGNRSSHQLLELVKHLKEKYQININGAEVLTNLDYLKSYKEIGQSFIMTNGKAILTNPDIINVLKENGITSVSLSYHFGIQDEFSPIKLCDLNEVINMFKIQDLEFRILTTITSSNYKLISDMCDKAYNMGARGIKFTNFLRQGNAKNLDISNILTDNEIETVFKEIIEARQKYDINDLLIERCGSFGKNHLSNHDHFFCDCITDSVVLTPDNNIYPCVFLAQPGFEIGKFEDGIVKIDENFINDHNRCLAKDICNEKVKTLVKRRNSYEKDKKRRFR